MNRQIRKAEHLKYSLLLSEDEVRNGFANINGFDDIELVHDALPELAFSDIDLSREFMNKEVSAPILINAITGGTEASSDINASFARVARECQVALAVGSQASALDDPVMEYTYRIARQENPNGVILANLGAMSSPDRAVKAVEMIKADALQLHLNVPQELAMKEGERDFAGVLDNIKLIAGSVPVPTIVKEVGFGLSREAVLKLYDAGVRSLDIGGRGGTNFVAIENLRHQEGLGHQFQDWGMTTATSLIEAASLNLPIHLTASGGIRSSADIAKAIALGAGMAGIAGPFLNILMQESEEMLLDHIRQLKEGLKAVLLLTGSKNLKELRHRPVVVMGRTREWLDQRGVDTRNLACRGDRV